MCGGGRTSRHPPLGIVGGGGRRNPGAGAPLSARAAPADGPARVNGFPAATSGSPVRGSCLSLEVPAESPPFPPATPQAHAHALPSTSGGGHGDGGGQVGPGLSLPSAPAAAVPFRRGGSPFSGTLRCSRGLPTSVRPRRGCPCGPPGDVEVWLGERGPGLWAGEPGALKYLVHHSSGY